MKINKIMKTKKSLKTYTLDELTDKYIGKQGTPKRDSFELELKLEMLSHAVKEARKIRNLTQEELGKLIGVQKSQISKLEKNLTNSRIDTIIKVFNALNVTLNFQLLFNKVDKSRVSFS